MADSYARALQRPAVVQLHSYAGLANGLGMMYYARRGYTPLVVIAGEAGLRYEALDGQMAADLVTMKIEELPILLAADAAPGEFSPGRNTEMTVVHQGYGDIGAVMRSAHTIVALELAVGRHTGVPMETRGDIGRYDAARDMRPPSEQLVRLPGVAEVAVVGAPDARLGERGCAFVRMQPGATAPDLQTVRAHLEQRGLARPKWPEDVRELTEFPRTASGKVQKFVLRQRLRDEALQQ